jgi:hypothetical protein
VEVIVPTQYEIACKLEELAERVREAEDVAEVAGQVEDELCQIQCDVHNRAGIDRSKKG